MPLLTIASGVRATPDSSVAPGIRRTPYITVNLGLRTTPYTSAASEVLHRSSGASLSSDFSMQDGTVKQVDRMLAFNLLPSVQAVCGTH